MDAFRACFMELQHKKSSPVWFVPHEDGGRLSNRGAAGVKNPYSVRYYQQTGTSRISVSLEHDGDEDKQVADEVRACW
jgi:hypothetical protein